MKLLLFISLIMQTNLLVFAQITNGLIAYFPFNGNADDESGNGYHATVIGATPIEDRFGNSNSAYLFDGIDDHIAYPTLYSSSPNQISIAAWFSSMDLQSDQKIVYHGDNGEFQLFVGIDSVWGGVHLGQSVADPWYYVREPITKNDWHMIVSVWIQDQSLRLYLNGDLVDSVGVSSEELLDPGQTYQPSIGSYNRSVGAYFNGMIDDIRIYDRELTAEEIDSLYNEGVSSVEQIDGVIPAEFILDQNYPNPFNPTTIIKYSVPEISFVDLSVYNPLGEKVVTLVNEAVEPGVYQAKFEGSGLPSGFYIATLRSNKFSESIKMILTK